MENTQVLKSFKQHMRANRRSKSYIKSYRVLVELSEFVHEKKFKEITAQEINTFLEWKRQNKARKGKYAHKKNLSDSSYFLYIQILKYFYRWLFNLPKFHYPEQVRHLNPKKPKTQPIKPSEILTKTDIVKLLNHCANFREKAMISSLYESACRVSEFLNWKIKDIVFDNKGAVIVVSGKTGDRRLRLIECVPHLQKWLQYHPQKHKKEAYVWYGNRVEQVDYLYLTRMLKRVFKRASINKPFNPHAFRHSRLTELAKYLTEAKLKVFAGWVGGSAMAGVYVHLSGADLDEDLMKAAGVEVAEQQIISPLKLTKCPRCNFGNSSEMKYCGQCGLPLIPEETISSEMELEKNVYELQDSVVMLRRELEIRKMRDIVEYVLATTPSDQQLKEFMARRHIEGSILKEDFMICLGNIDGAWVYIPEYDNYGFTFEAQQQRAKMFNKQLSPHQKEVKKRVEEWVRKSG